MSSTNMVAPTSWPRRLLTYGSSKASTPLPACLSDTGILRWYASCCRTPFGNTPRDRKTHYVGLIHSCLAEQPLNASFGPARIRLHTKSARGSVSATPVSAVLAILKLIGLIAPARLTRQYDDNPFFDPVSGGPIKQPRVLSEAEASALRSAA